MKCKVEKLCGGCSNLKCSKALQAKQKQEYVENIMERAGLQVKVAPVLMAKNDLYYRNKVIVGFAKNKEKKSVFGSVCRSFTSSHQYKRLSYAAKACE